MGDSYLTYYGRGKSSFAAAITNKNRLDGWLAWGKYPMDIYDRIGGQAVSINETSCGATLGRGTAALWAAQEVGTNVGSKYEQVAGTTLSFRTNTWSEESVGIMYMFEMSFTFNRAKESRDATRTTGLLLLFKLEEI